MVGIGVIGYGGRIADLLDKVPGIGTEINVMALCDPSQQSRSRCKKSFGEIAIYDDYKQLVNDPSIEWVIIGSWNCFHRDHVLAAIEAGKHVFCEKPLGITIDECIDIKQTVMNSNSKFAIGFVLRFSPHYLKIKSLIDSGSIGKIISMEFNETIHFNHGGYIFGDWRRLRKNAGTHILEKCCHDVDLVNWLVGSRACRIASFGGRNFFKPENDYHIARIAKDEKGLDAYRTWPGTISLNPFTSDKDIFDNQVAIIEYENGVRTTFHSNCNAGIPERRMYILGTEGAIRADVLSGKIELQRIGHCEPCVDESSQSSGGHGGADHLLAKQISDAIVNDITLSPGIDEAVDSAVTCFGIDQAADSGCVVDMNPIWQNLYKQCTIKKTLNAL